MRIGLVCVFPELCYFYQPFQWDGDALKILVVSLDNLGDLVFATSLLQSLRDDFPGGFIGLWCKDYARSIADLISGVDRIHAADPFWDKSPGRGAGRFSDLYRSVREIRAEKYDLVLLLTRGSKPLLATSLLGAKATIGREGNKFSALLVGAVPGSRPDVAVTLELDRFACAAHAWFSIVPAARPCSDGTKLPPPYRLNRPQTSGDSSPVPKGTVALHPFAGSQRRCVPLPVWQDFSRKLIEAGRTVLWIGSSSELSVIRNTGSHSDHEYFVDQLTGIGSGLRGSIEAISSCGFFVGHDSGPLHIAGALGVPVLGIYAPGEPGRTFPQGAGISHWIHRSSPAEFNASLFWDEFKVALVQCEGVQGNHP